MADETRRVCLDTDVVIDYLKGTEETSDIIQKLYFKFDEIALTVITVYELLFGVEYMGGKDRLEIETIISSSCILPLDEESARESAKISATLKKSGKQIGIADELIGAICITSDSFLLTKNAEHFRRINNLRVLELNEIR